jgi:transposase InsO family protein
MGFGYAGPPPTSPSLLALSATRTASSVRRRSTCARRSAASWWHRRVRGRNSQPTCAPTSSSTPYGWRSPCEDPVRIVTLVHHSDAGSQYTSFNYAEVLDDHGVLASMGTVGDADDNAPASPASPGRGSASTSASGTSPSPRTRTVMYSPTRPSSTTPSYSLLAEQEPTQARSPRGGAGGCSWRTGGASGRTPGRRSLERKRQRACAPTRAAAA